MRFPAFMIFSFVALCSYAQSYIETGYTPSRSFIDKNRNKHGSGDLWQTKGRYSFPISTKMNPNGQPVVWAGTVSGMYALMNNEGYAAEYNPGQILNLSFNVSHIRPLSKKSKKWYIISSLGAGIYSAPNDIAWRSILVNGAVVFAYRLHKNLDVGVGAGLTNSFGVPLVMPMTFLKWTSSGKFEIKVESMGNINASAAYRFNERFKLAAVCNMDGMSSVFRKDGKNKIYSVMRMRAFLQPELRVGKRSAIYLNAGGELFHSVNITNMSIKGFADNFTKNDRWKFRQTFNVMAGFKYGF